MIHSKKFEPRHRMIWVAKLLTGALILMYGFVPYLVDHFGKYELDYSGMNLLFSLVLLLVLFMLPSKARTLKGFNVLTEKRNTVITLVIFCIAGSIFFVFPWHDDRVSVGASVAAFFRALWFVTAASYINSTERTRAILICATIILMFIDESRTYFLLILLILGARSKYKYSVLGVGILMAILLAAFRSADTQSVLDLFLYGIIGEGVNATRPVGQILQSSDVSFAWHRHISHTLLQPILIPLDVFVSKLSPGLYNLQSYYLSTLVSSSLAEKFNPMGGWYISADFVYYGLAGLPVMCISLLLTWKISRAILDTRSFPFGAFFIFIFVKSTPYVYWKFVLYIVMVAFAYHMLLLLLTKKQRQPFATISV